MELAAYDPMVEPTATDPFRAAGAGTLPMAGAAAPERADAARNRRRILEAAARLLDERGAGGMSMEAVAREACVGKGTLFRRFGDRAGLGLALLEAGERDFQERVIRGAPPLGPGAPPVERLVAFGRALVSHTERHPELLALVAEDPVAWLRSGVYAAYRAHVGLLLEAADPRLDAAVLADALLATLRADLIVHLREERSVGSERLCDAWEALVRGLADGAR